MVGAAGFEPARCKAKVLETSASASSAMLPCTGQKKSWPDGSPDQFIISDPQVEHVGPELGFPVEKLIRRFSVPGDQAEDGAFFNGLLLKQSLFQLHHTRMSSGEAEQLQLGAVPIIHIYNGVFRL